MERKATLLALIEQAYEQERALVAALTAEERAQPGTYEHWSAKDLIAHNAAWVGRLADDLLAAAEGRPTTRSEDWDGFEHENERIFEAYRTHTWDELLEFAGQVHGALVERVSELSEEALASTDALPRQGERPLWRLIAGTAGIHPVSHCSGYYGSSGDQTRAGAVLGDVTRAMASLDDSPGWQGTVHYNLACHHSLLGRKVEAIEELRRALGLNRELIEWSKEDPDLESIRGEPACERIYAEIGAGGDT